MRYFFRPELEMLLGQVGFRLLDNVDCQTLCETDYNSWTSYFIQTAIDKRKRKEWVHIYIAECDARKMSQIPASLSSALTALSDRVRIIPMADDESGTCIIEMPDEIVDASAATQLNNLRTILSDTANSGSGISLG